MSRSAVAAVLLLVGATGRGSAQDLSVEAAVDFLRVRSEIGGASETVRGPAVEVRGSVRWGVVGAVARYVGGTAGDPDAGAADRDVVDARLLATIRLHPLVTVMSGVHARAQVSDWGTRRQVLWEVALRAAVPLGPVLSAHGEAWLAPTGSSNMSTTFESARGGEAGLALALPHTRLRLTLRYRIDRGSGGVPDYVEAAETVSLGARITLR